MESQANNSRWWTYLRVAVIGRNPLYTLIRIIVLVVVVILTYQFALLPVQIKGPSMLPTYAENGVNFVNRLAYRTHEPQRGDVVTIRYSGTSIMLMKRVIGLPGETIAFHAGRVSINGTPLDEPYIKYPTDWEIPATTLAAGKYFVVGDNRSMPQNQHTFGETERQRIVGKILLCKNLFASSPSSR
jgi:signal peptidase I